MMIKYDPSTIIILPLFLLGLILILVLVLFLSGWFKLSKEYPLPSDIGTVIKTYKWRSLNINYLAAYRSLMNIIITDKGIAIRPTLKLLILHNPIFFRWEQLTDFNYMNGLVKSIVFKVSNKRIAMYGDVANEIFIQKNAWDKRNTNSNDNK